MSRAYGSPPEWPRRALACVVVWSLWLLSGSSSAHAQSGRFAFVLGNNVGAQDEAPLRHSHLDAERVSQALQSFSGVPPEHVVKLLDADSAVVLRALDNLSARVRDYARANPGAETILFFYYSGHADAAGLHLGRTRLELSALRALFAASSAGLNVVILDACRSGELTRVKGAEPAEPFHMSDLGASSNRGVAILTSSSSDEDSQESDRLKGSFFTHHLVAGLRGPADASSDGTITLSELYEYAFTETLRATSRQAVVQHPTFAIDLRGHRDVVMVREEYASGTLATLTLERPGDYLIFRGDAEGELLAEVRAAGATHIRVPAGRYFMRVRGEGGVLEGVVAANPSEVLAVSLDGMTRVPFAQALRKGHEPRRDVSLRLGLLLGVNPTHPTSERPQVLAAVGVGVDMSALSVEMRLRMSQSAYGNDIVSLRERAGGASVAAVKLFDLGGWAAGGGLRLGADLVAQDGEPASSVPPRLAPRWFGGAFARAHGYLTPGLSVVGEVGAEGVLQSLVRGVRDDPRIDASFSPSFWGGVSWSFF